jgi:carboxylesterase type B
LAGIGCCWWLILRKGLAGSGVVVVTVNYWVGFAWTSRSPSATPTSRFAARFLGSPPPADFGPLSEQLRAAWTAFAATGDPGWPRFDLQHRRTRIWDTTPRDAADPLADSRRIWQAVAAAGPSRSPVHGLPGWPR